jgi:DNA-directed RNA polymerase I, II, and III subunit RPABC1
VLIVEESISPFARTAIQEMSEDYRFEVFRDSELLIDITAHRLVPEHLVLSEIDKASLLKRYHLKDTQLPLIQQNDPVARYFGLKRGQVVKIVRPSETAGRYVTYRVCI